MENLKSYKADVKELELYTNSENKTEARKDLKEIAKEQDIKLPASFKISEVEID